MSSVNRLTAHHIIPGQKTPQCLCYQSERDRQTDRKRDRETDRQRKRDRETERQRDRNRTRKKC